MKHFFPILLILLLTTTFAETSLSSQGRRLSEKEIELKASQILKGYKDIHVISDSSVVETVAYKDRNVSLDTSRIKQTMKEIFRRSASEYGVRDNMIFEHAPDGSTDKNVMQITYSLRSSDLPTKKNTIIYSAVTFHVSFDCNTCKSAEEKLMVQKYLDKVASRVKATPFILTRDFSTDFKTNELGYIPNIYERGLDDKYILKNVRDSFIKGVDLQVKQLSSIITDGKLSWP